MHHLKDVIADQVVVDLVEPHEMVASDPEIIMGVANVDQAVDQVEDSHAIAKTAIKFALHLHLPKKKQTQTHTHKHFLALYWISSCSLFDMRILSMPDQILNFVSLKLKKSKLQKMV
jgi:hypothetical protein